MSGIVAGYFPHIPFPRALGKDYVEPDVRGLRNRFTLMRASPFAMDLLFCGIMAVVIATATVAYLYSR